MSHSYNSSFPSENSFIYVLEHLCVVQISTHIIIGDDVFDMVVRWFTVDILNNWIDNSEMLD